MKIIFGWSFSNISIRTRCFVCDDDCESGGVELTARVDGDAHDWINGTVCPICRHDPTVENIRRRLRERSQKLSAQAMMYSELAGSEIVLPAEGTWEQAELKQKSSEAEMGA